MTMNKAIDTEHIMRMSDGMVVITTWHDTRKEAQARIVSVPNTTFSKVFPCGILGAFRAVTWTKEAA